MTKKNNTEIITDCEIDIQSLIEKFDDEHYALMQYLFENQEDDD